jgi:phospholipid/cholesterol/gamma-HCH transport system substrate-binding protein
MAISWRVLRRALALALIAALLSACGSWRGAANVPLPGGPGTRDRHLTVYVQMSDTLGLNVNSRVRVADVYVGRVRAITLENWIATLTVDLEPDIRLPATAMASIGQTNLLGSQHLEIAAPPDPSAHLMKDGDTIPLENSSAFPNTERVLAGIATIVRGGGIHNLEGIQTEIYNMLTGRAHQIREFLDRLDTFTDELNLQREDLTHAIDSTSRLLAIVAQRADTLNRVLAEFPPLLRHLADTRDLFTDAVDAMGRLSEAIDHNLSRTNGNLHANLQNLQRPLKQLARSGPYLIRALPMLLGGGFSITNMPKAIRGDYINASITVDLTLSGLDNGYLSGTGVSGMLRALEQAWGRDPGTMVPDVRFTPNPHDAPGGPLVERGE